MDTRKALIIAIIIVYSIAAAGIVFLVITLSDQPPQLTAAVNSQPEISREAAPVETPSFPVYDAGTYKVGSDIPADEYIIASTGGSAYYQISSDSSGEISGIITNDNFDTFTIVTVTDGNYLTVKRANFFSLDEYIEDNLESINRVGLREDGTFGQGMYKVGVMIPAGEYRLESTGGLAYMARLNSSDGTLGAIITSDNFENDTYVTVYNGEYLQVKRAIIIPTS